MSNVQFPGALSNNVNALRNNNISRIQNYNFQSSGGAKQTNAVADDFNVPPYEEEKNGFLKLVEELGPFFNEIMIVLNLYEGKWKNPIDLVALSSIVWNVVKKFKLSSMEGLINPEARAFLEGLNFLLFSFIAPQAFIPFVQKSAAKMLPFFGTRMGKIASGLIGGVGGLEICVRLWDHYVTPFVAEKLMPWVKQQFSSNKNPAFVSS